jgi:hypothetical protein
MAKVVNNPNQLDSPRWAGDFFTAEERLLPGGARLDPTQFHGNDAVQVVVGAAGALAAATSVPVGALSGPIPSGTLLDFGGAKFAVLTAPAATGAVTLTVRALPTALVSGDTAIYEGTELNTVVSGTLVGRTYAERDANTGFGPAADADDEFYLVAFEVQDVTNNADVTLYRHGGVVYENFLPVFSALSSTLKGKIRTLYESTIGRD